MEKSGGFERKFNEKKLMIREAGFVALVIILFLQYWKLVAYLSNQYFFDSSFMSPLVHLVLITGIPLSYFAAKYLVQVIKKVI